MEEDFKRSFNYDFRSDLEDLYRLHYITKKYDHIIEYQKGAWRLFEPSKFIYAYFAFNSFYNFDWEKSLQDQKLCLLKKVVKNGEEKVPYESDKFKFMIYFILKNLDDGDKELFVKMIKGEENIVEILNAILNITPDIRIENSEREKFKIKFRNLLKSGDVCEENLMTIIQFIYMVRNNIFHGTKNTIEMAETFQRKRLEIYSNILIAVNEMLFIVLKRMTAFTIQEKYDLIVNQ